MVALSYLNLNPVPRVITLEKEQVDDDSSRYAAPPGPRRRRVTPELRAKVAARYEHGETSRHVAEACDIAKTTVLAILKTEGVEVRPQGRHS